MKFFFIFLFLCIVQHGYSQKESWFFIHVKDSTYMVDFVQKEGVYQYAGTDKILKVIFDRYTIKKFKRTEKLSNNKKLKKTFFVISEGDGLLETLLRDADHVFIGGRVIPESERKIFEPNDYGTTSTIGDELGLPIKMDYLDILGLPQAWYYTTGNRDVIIGISDATVDTTNLEFKGKTTEVRKSSFSKGHGNGVAFIAAGQGNNGYGGAGICYDCSIYATSYGDFKNFSQLRELSDLGVKVINCSWASTRGYESGAQTIEDIYKNGTLVVASAGNKTYKDTKGETLMYPASHKYVISVSQAMFKFDKPEDNILYEKSGAPYAENIFGYLSRTVGFENNDLEEKKRNYPISIPTLNREVDILAPTVGVLRFSRFITAGEIDYTSFTNTSTASPFVTGTIALMFSLAPCLPVEEVESILKLTSTNIDSIDANRSFAGKYGAGMLHIGRAVEMVFLMFAEKEPVKIENQSFNRWDFKLTSISEVVMKNQKFIENATLELTSKKRITISKNTILKPNSTGKIHLKIDPLLEKQCELRLRDPSILND